MKTCYRLIFKAALALAFLPGLTIAANAAGIPIDVSSMGIKKTAQIKVWKSNIEMTDTIGTFGRGLFCSDKVDIKYTKGIDGYNVIRVSKVFAEQSSLLGFPKYEGDESAFSEKLGAEADFKIGFTLLSMNYELCGDDKEYSGKGSIKLKVELFSTKTKRIAYSNTLVGTFSSEKKMKGESFDDALFASALNTMFSDRKYVEVFKDDEQLAAVGEKISIENGSKPVDGVKKNSKELTNLVVTVESGLGTGSGFFIGNTGYVITNYHVVGEGRFVKVKVAGGHGVIGEVLRKDAVRDVALVKTPLEPPASIAIRSTPVKIGEEVYAIGSPFGVQLSGTTTRGIVSAERTIENLRYIQSDVSINQGNSGGPLLDAAGETLAIAVLKKENAAGIGLFIPILEVFDRLGIQVK